MKNSLAMAYVFCFLLWVLYLRLFPCVLLVWSALVIWNVIIFGFLNRYVVFLFYNHENILIVYTGAIIAEMVSILSFVNSVCLFIHILIWNSVIV